MVVLLFPFSAFASIAFDNAGACTPASSASNISCSLTVGSGANRIEIIGIWADDNVSISGQITTVSYASVEASSLATSTTANGNEAVYLWCLVAPTSGSNTLKATFTGMSGGDTFNVMATSYSGVTQTCSGLTTAIGSTNSGTNPTVSLTGSGSSPWLVGIASNSNSAVTAGSNTTSRVSDADSRNMSDSNGLVSPSALNWTSSSGAWAAAVVNLTAAGSVSSPSPILLTSVFWW